MALLAWVLTLGAIAAHTEAIVRLMLHLGPYSIGLLEAISMLAWTLAVIACFIAIEKSNRAIGAILLVLAALGCRRDGHRTHLSWRRPRRAGNSPRTSSCPWRRRRCCSPRP